MIKITVFLAMTAISILSYANIERFFIGDIEVSRQDYIDADSTLIRAKETWISADTTKYIITPGLYSNIDSISHPGRILLTKKSDKEIARIDSLMSAYYTVESAKLKVGDKMPDFTLYMYLDKGKGRINYEENFKGKVLLINFWASWCGPCIEELKTPHLPSFIKDFGEDERFVFLPISVNHNRSELDKFFNSPTGKEMEWLKNETAWDKDGELAGMMSAGGVPITILVDADGVIMQNEAKALLQNDDISRLKAKITGLLRIARQ